MNGLMTKRGLTPNGTQLNLETLMAAWKIAYPLDQPVIGMMSLAEEARRGSVNDNYKFLKRVQKTKASAIL